MADLSTLPEESWDLSSARSEALDRLARPPERRTLFHRPGFRRPGRLAARLPVAAPDHDDLGPAGERGPDGDRGRDGDGDPPVAVHRSRRPVTAVGGLGSWQRWRNRPGVLLSAGAALLAVVVWLGWTQLRPPVPVEDLLPRASTTVAATGSSAGSATPVTRLPATGGGDRAATASTEGVQVTVHVAGAVARPGVVTLPSGSRVVDAVASAGGLRPDADPDRVNLAAPLADGQRIAVPVLGQPLPAEAPVGGGAGPEGEGGGATGSSGPVDLNTADAAALDELPGIGPATAAAILDHRDQHGPFASIEDLLDVRGIGEAKLESLRDLVTVTGG